jgi:hypothetical protein
MSLRRFWFEFSNSPANLLDIQRVGVTAADERDAVALVSTWVFRGAEFPLIRSVVPDIDVSTLDPRHVRPNMGNPAVRGVWFPLGYSLLG